jgi:hypothetical protein
LLDQNVLNLPRLGSTKEIGSHLDATRALPSWWRFFWLALRIRLPKFVIEGSRMRASGLGLSLLLIAHAASADSMRCDKWVVNETVTPTELTEKCGAPTSKTLSTEDVMARNANTNRLYKVGTKVTERWLYRRGTQSLPMLVTIVDGKIQSIERAE